MKHSNIIDLTRVRRHRASRHRTQCALQAMKAYFEADSQGLTRQQRERLREAWLSAVRQLRQEGS